MPAWIVHEPYTAPDGRDYRSGDTFVADAAPGCDATALEVASDDPDKPRQKRQSKQQIEAE